MIYSLKRNSIEKTNYKTLEEFYSNECQMTYKTYHLKLQSDINDMQLKIIGMYFGISLNKLIDLIMTYVKKYAEHSDTLGTVNYKLIAKVDSGTFGNGFRCRDRNDIEVAIKRFKTKGENLIIKSRDGQ